MNTLTYKGYTARIDFDDRDNSLVGRLLGIQDIIGFHADNVADLHTAFEEAVDDYLEACEKIGKSPEKGHKMRLLSSAHSITEGVESVARCPDPLVGSGRYCDRTTGACGAI